MATSQTPIQIVNTALLQLGSSTITSFEDGTNEALVMLAHYDRARQGMLRDNPWNFSMKRALLAEVTDANLPPSSASDFAHVFELPSDFISLRKVMNDVDYRMEGNRILSKEETCEILYVYNVEDVALFDPKFEEALIAYLTAEMGYSFTRDIDVRAQNYAIYQEKIAQAKFSNAIEDIEEQIGDEDRRLTLARFF